MRIIIIRHAEPDYEHNTITPNGFIEASALARRLLKEKIDYVYLSPLGRAQDTAREYLELSKKEAITYDWLQEFFYRAIDSKTGKERLSWDFPVKQFTNLKGIYDNSQWINLPSFKKDVKKGYKYVIENFDKLLASHGYVRKGKYYKAVNSNHDTLVFFCHLGLECVLLSHLFNLPFPALAQHFSPVPSSVSIIYTEERVPGIAQFRAQSLGDISHLNNENITPSFMGRFRECKEDNTRK